MSKTIINISVLLFSIGAIFTLSVPSISHTCALLAIAYAVLYAGTK